MTAELVASYLEAVGTVAAVVLALFLQVVLVRIRRPRLYLTLSSDLADQDVVGLTDRSGPGQALWVRAKVWNHPGKTQAQNVQILVSAVRVPADRASDSDQVPAGLVLNWADTRFDAIRIPPGVWRRVDLLECRLQYSDIASPSVWWPGYNKLVDVYPPSNRYWLETAGPYELELVLTADDCKPSYWRLTFTFTPGAAGSSAVETLAQFKDITLRPVSRP